MGSKFLDYYKNYFKNVWNWDYQGKLWSAFIIIFIGAILISTFSGILFYIGFALMVVGILFYALNYDALFEKTANNFNKGKKNKIKEKSRKTELIVGLFLFAVGLVLIFLKNTELIFVGYMLVLIGPLYAIIKLKK